MRSRRGAPRDRTHGHPRVSRSRLISGYCVRVLTEAVRPLGALTVVVQLLNTARIRTAPIVDKIIVRIPSIRKNPRA